MPFPTEHLICPICGSPFAAEEKTLRCPNRHAFDLAKQGYVNLLTGHKREHGDNRIMIEGRHRFLEKGYYAPLRDAVANAAISFAPHAQAVLDAGCGEGYYTQGVKAALPGATVYGFDISKEAILFACRRHCAHLFIASCYSIPLQDHSMDAILCLFSPFAGNEFGRILKKGGILMLAIPGPRHLWGLKSILYETPYENKPEDPQMAGYTLLQRKAVEGQILISGQEDIQDLFSMTPYYYRTPEAGRKQLAAQETLQTEISFQVLIYRKDGDEAESAATV